MRFLPSKANGPGLLVAAAASTLIAVLVAGGPFFDATRNATARPIELKFLPGDRQIATSVGVLDQDAHAYKSKHTQGALVYGPYITLPAGSYAVSWAGTAGVTARPQFEVFSVRAGVVASSNALLPVSPVSAQLQRVEFDLKEKLEEVELRVLVEAGDELSIAGVTLQINPAKGAGHE